MRSVDEARTRSWPWASARANPTSLDSSSSEHLSTRVHINSMTSKSATSVSASSIKVRASHSSRPSIATPFIAG